MNRKLPLAYVLGLGIAQLAVACAARVVAASNTFRTALGRRLGFAVFLAGALLPVKAFPQDGSTAVTALALEPGTSGIVYAGTQAGVLKSIDSGASWIGTGLNGPVSSLVIDPASASTVYALVDGIVHKSIDRGTS